MKESEKITRRIAQFDVSLELLASILCLPDGVEITDVRMAPGVWGNARIRVQGGDLPMTEAWEPIPRVKPTYLKEENDGRCETQFAGWVGLP